MRSRSGFYSRGGEVGEVGGRGGRSKNYFCLIRANLKRKQGVTFFGNLVCLE